jgi:glutamate racemase
VGLEPAVKPAAELTKTGKIGILATEGTFRGGHFKKTSHEFANGVDIYTQVGDGLVKLVENNETDTDEALDLLKKYINPMIENEVDNLVLGCTHYPFLSETIKKIEGAEKLNIINPAPSVALQTKKILLGNEAENKTPVYKFYSNTNHVIIKKLLDKIVENKISALFYEV